MIEKEVNTVFLDRYIDDDDEVSLIDIHKAKKRADQSDKRFMDKVYDAIALYDIKMPDIKRYVLSLILVPSIILVISYIPEYIGDYSIKNQSVDKAASVIYTLEDAFKDDSYSIYYDDPNDAKVFEQAQLTQEEQDVVRKQQKGEQLTQEEQQILKQAQEKIQQQELPADDKQVNESLVAKYGADYLRKSGSLLESLQKRMGMALDGKN